MAPSLYFGEPCDIWQQLFDVYTIIPLDSDPYSSQYSSQFLLTTVTSMKCNLYQSNTIKPGL